jgi:hypothetical protein
MTSPGSPLGNGVGGVYNGSGDGAAAWAGVAVSAAAPTKHAVTATKAAVSTAVPPAPRYLIDDASSIHAAMRSALCGRSLVRKDTLVERTR